MEKKKYHWFVEPKNDNANEVIVRPLGELSEVEMNLDLKDDQGFGHNVYEVPNSAFITRLYHSVLKSPADFVVFKRQGDDGPIKFWTRPNSNRPQNLKKVSIK